MFDKKTSNIGRTSLKAVSKAGRFISLTSHDGYDKVADLFKAAFRGVRLLIDKPLNYYNNKRISILNVTLASAKASRDAKLTNFLKIDNELNAAKNKVDKAVAALVPEDVQKLNRLSGLLEKLDKEMPELNAMRARSKKIVKPIGLDLEERDRFLTLSDKITELDAVEIEAKKLQEKLKNNVRYQALIGAEKEVEELQPRHTVAKNLLAHYDGKVQRVTEKIDVRSTKQENICCVARQLCRKNQWMIFSERSSRQ